MKNALKEGLETVYSFLISRDTVLSNEMQVWKHPIDT